MNPDEKQRPSERDNAGAANGTGAKTPSADMQPEDAGTPDSGNQGTGAAAEKAMKQTSKTPAERDKR